jgi:tetratricopeptide (TPR) repeat protein
MTKTKTSSQKNPANMKTGGPGNKNTNNMKNQSNKASVKSSNTMSISQNTIYMPDTNPLKRYQHLIIIGIIILLAFIIYSNSLHNGFVDFDDPENITENTSIRAITWDNIVYYFTTAIQFTYSPLVFFSFATDYMFDKLNPAVFHFTSLLYHLLNIVLVYFLFMLLTRRWTISAFVATLFAIHPVNVDGITWLATRSNVMYTFFYLGAIICYIYYIKSNYQLKYLLGSAFLFLLSVLCKAPAVVLLPSLFLLDYYYNRKWDLKKWSRNWDFKRWNWKLLYEKTPFVLVAIFTAYLAFHFRADMGTNPHHYNLFDRFIVICHSMTSYFDNLLAPFHLSYAYAYPSKVDGLLPYYYYLAPLILILIPILLWKLKISKKVILIGLSFFFLNIILSQAYILMDNFKAHRYAYLPYIGLYFILADFNEQVIGATEGWRSQIKKAWKVVLVVFLVVFSLLTYTRNGLWKDTMTIFNDTINKEPNIPYTYITRGLNKYKNNNHVEALKDFDRAAELEPDSYLAYYYKGKAKVGLKDYPGALNDFSKALELKNDYSDIYYERAILKEEMKNPEAALTDYDLSIQYNPKFSGAYNNRGNLKWTLKDYQGAMSDYTLAIENDPYFPEAYNNRASLKYELKDYQGAAADYSKAIEVKPDYAEAYYNRGLAKQQLGDKTGMCADWTKALEMGYTAAQSLIQQYCGAEK